MAAIPGSTLPSIASRSAPPPVEMYDTWSAIPNLLIHATESPPPINENAPFFVASAIASPIVGALFNKVNTKVMYLLGAILSGGGFLAFSMCNKLWQFYVIAAVVQIGTAVISSIGVPLLINRWFDEETKGKAMGIAFAGSGLGNIFLQQLVVSSLVANGAAKKDILEKNLIHLELME